MAANRKMPHGHWEVPQKNPLPGERTPHADNVDTALGKKALSYADEHTGLNGDF